MKNKRVFWALTLMLGVPVIAALAFATGTIIMNDFPAWQVFIIIIPVIIVITIMFFVGRFVYEDAKYRGLDPWLWTTIAVFVPNLIGLIIYLVFRSQHSIENKICRNCHKNVNKEYNICPYCGNNLSARCENCGEAIEEDWIVCPKCAKPLKAKDSIEKVC